VALPVTPKLAIGGRHRIAATRAIPVFGRQFAKRFTLCSRTVVLSVCPVCNVGVLWPNGWMDQDASWYKGRSRPRRHCVRWGHSFPPTEKGTAAPSFRPMSIVAKQSPISVTAELLYKPDQSTDADSDSSCAASAAYSINNLSAAPHASLTVQLSTPDREHCQSVVAALTGITSNAADRRKFTRRLPRRIIDDQPTNGRHAAHRQTDS